MKETDTRVKRGKRTDPPTNAGQFAGKPGPGRGKRRPLVFAGSSVYADMKQVLSTAPSTSDSEGVKAARRLFKKDYKGFATMMAKYEREEKDALLVREAADELVAKKAEPAEVGVKEANVDVLIARLLVELSR